jgi:hypothetical protein
MIDIARDKEELHGARPCTESAAIMTAAIREVQSRIE